MEVRVACIIEGQGEREAVPIVVRRIAWRLDPALKVQVPACIRISRNKLVKAGELERAVELAARKVGSQGAVLVMLDSDDDCPAELGPQLLRRATQARGNLPLAVVLPKREFESWFLAAAASLREHRGLAADIQPPSNPESIRGAKEWLSQRMGVDRQYIETLDQAPLAARFDLDLARRADSFDKCYRDVVRLLNRHPRLCATLSGECLVRLSGAMAARPARDPGKLARCPGAIPPNAAEIPTVLAR